MFVDYATNITVTRVIAAIRLVDSPVGVTTCRQNREYWALLLKIKGKTVYTVDGMEMLSDASHPVILPKGCTYSWKCTEPGECLIIDFDAVESGFSPTNFKIKGTHPIESGFSKIERALNRAEQRCAVEPFFCLYEMLNYVLKSERSGYLPTKKSDALRPAIEYITASYFDVSITNDFLARLCGMSTVYFRKTFTSVYGISPVRYLHNFRTERAKAILQSDFESVEQVALSVGYGSIYHFSKMFKLYTGKSPSEYVRSGR